MATLIGAAALTPVLSFGLALLGGSLVGARHHREVRRFNVECRATIARQARGDLATAREFFWRWSETTRSANVAAVARFNLAWTLIYQAQLEHAVVVLTDCLARYELELRRQKLLHRAHVARAIAQALLSSDAAEASLALALASRGDQPLLFGVYVVAIVETRRGAPETAVKQLDDAWISLESSLTTRDLRPIRVVRAFALAALGPREAGRASAALAGLRPTFPGELAYLGAAWPEMAAFLASHELHS